MSLEQALEFIDDDELVEVTPGADPLRKKHVEECGNGDGLPVLFVHGGPGAGCDAVGGSWGATLSLAYAQRHPQRVLGMVLRGVFLCRDRDLHWFYRDGANRVFPDFWAELCAAVPRPRDGNYIRAFHRALTNDNELARMAAAKAWVQWEARCSTLHRNLGHAHDPPNALAMATLETHYFMQRSFLQENQLLDNAGMLAGIPGIIVHGRYDMVCALDNALALHRAWPESELHIVDSAGHAASEPAITHALVEATDAMANEFWQE
jgi:proline iminopeptidase